MKWCNKCEEWKDESEFNKNKKMKDGLLNQCKKCQKEYGKEWREKNKEWMELYRINNKEKRSKNNKEWEENNKEWRKQYRKNNKERDKQTKKEWEENNKEYIKQLKKEWNENNKNWKKQQRNQYYVNNKNWERQREKVYQQFPLKYNSVCKLRKEIELYEEIRQSVNDNVEIKCVNCENWFEPTKGQIKRRLNAIDGKLKGEHKLYCSDECKESCPVYNQKKYPKHNKPYLDREAQPELSKMVLERDEYTCIKCQRHQSKAELHCHHIDGIQWNPIESADMDTCTTLCKDCHKEVHQEKECTYSDMRCSFQVN